jgi:spore coat protein CotH
MSAFCQSAVYPFNGTLYDGKIHRIDLLVQTDSLADLLKDENRWTNHSYPVTFIYDKLDTLIKVGLRLKGNTSRGAYKKSFRLDLDEFLKQDYQGIKTLNLHGDHNDPSKIREYLSLSILNKANQISLRSNLVALHINGVYMGLYSNTEYVNKTFIESRFNNKNGNLYKCTWPADLVWIDNNQKSYKDLLNPSPLNERAYDLKINEKEDDYADLMYFINTINNTPTANFAAALDTIFDTDAYLKSLAAEVLIGHWDNYFFNKNNYYLYYDTHKKKFVYITYDVDNSLGVQWGVQNINNRNIYAWGNLNNTKAPLTHKMLAIEAYKRKYEAALFGLIQTIFNEDSLFGMIDSLKSKLTPYIESDPFYNGTFTSDYGFDFDDFSNSFTEKVISHATYGIKPYISTRKASALAQFVYKTGEEETPIDLTFRIYPNPIKTNLFIENERDEFMQVKIYDLQMKLLKQFEIGAGLNELDVADCRKGIYLLVIEGTRGKFLQKICIDGE